MRGPAIARKMPRTMKKITASAISHQIRLMLKPPAGSVWFSIAGAAIVLTGTVRSAFRWLRYSESVRSTPLVTPPL